MLHTLQTLVGSAVMERLTLLVNHVLASEPVALRRLQPHAGRCISIRFDGWPGMLPPVPPATFRVTPAGMLEWLERGVPEEADLRVNIDASNPARAAFQALVGDRPRVAVSGDAAFAGDVNWLFDNLRWDFQDDLANLFGPVPARELSRLGAAVATGMRGAARALGAVAERLRESRASGGGSGESAPR